MTADTPAPMGQDETTTVVTYVALLRGINVGTGKRIPMAELRELAAGLGWTSVRTYLQSGNVVFEAPDGERPARLGAVLTAAVRRRFDIEPAVVVLTVADLAQVRAHCPWPERANAEPRTVHAVVLSRTADDAIAGRVSESVRRLAGDTADVAVVTDRVVYLLLPGGLGTSRLAAALTRPGGLGSDVVGTARNWSTVTALAVLADSKN